MLAAGQLRRAGPAPPPPPGPTPPPPPRAPPAPTPLYQRRVLVGRLARQPLLAVITWHRILSPGYRPVDCNRPALRGCAKPPARSPHDRGDVRPGGRARTARTGPRAVTMVGVL